MPKDYYVSAVPDSYVKLFEVLKRSGYDYQEVFKYAMKKVFEKPLEEIIVDLAKDKYATVQKAIAEGMP